MDDAATSPLGQEPDAVGTHAGETAAGRRAERVEQGDDEAVAPRTGLGARVQVLADHRVHLPSVTLRTLASAALTVAFLAVVAVVALWPAGGEGAGRGLGGALSGGVSADSVDVGFTRDLVYQQQQGAAVSMTRYALSHDPQVQVLAYDLALADSETAGQAQGWLAGWGVSVSSEKAPLAWDLKGSAREAIPEQAESLGTSPGAEVSRLVPGVPSQSDLDRLNNAPDPDRDRHYLEMMLAHAQGTEALANAALQYSLSPLAQQGAEEVGERARGQQSAIEALLQP